MSPPPGAIGMLGVILAIVVVFQRPPAWGLVLFLGLSGLALIGVQFLAWRSKR